jgi:hypothetical protein
MFTLAGEFAPWAGGVGLGRFLSPSWSLEKTAPFTGALTIGFRWRTDLAFGPHRLAWVRSRGGAPAGGERVDQEEASTGLGVWGGVLQLREVVAPGVGDLDAQGAADDVDGEPEVPAGDAAVRGGVRREFGHDERRRVRREPPGAELLGGEETGEVGSSWGG